jgi:hypothetical protein
METGVPKPRVIWYEDSQTMGIHRDLVRAGMDRARQQGKRIGRPRVTARPHFAGLYQAALKQIDSHLPHEGLLPSELFVEAFDRNAELIKQLCCLKYQCRDFEKEGELDIVIHRRDIFALRT